MECCQNINSKPASPATNKLLANSHSNTAILNQEEPVFDNDYDYSPLTMSNSAQHNAHDHHSAPRFHQHAHHQSLYTYDGSAAADNQLAGGVNNNINSSARTSSKFSSRAKSLDMHSREQTFLNSTGFMLFMSEFFATFVFVYLGQCALTSFELTGTQNDTLTRQLATLTTYGLAYLLAITLAINLSGAHLNPAYTVARALFGLIRWRRACSYVIAQYCGAYLAAMFLHATYCDKLGQRHLEGLLMGMNVTLRAHGNILSTGKLFSSFPPTEVSLNQLIISYMLATCFFTMLVHFVHELPSAAHHSTATTSSSKNNHQALSIPINLKPFYLACALCISLAAFSANGGPVLNPAQDVAPRLYIASSGWGAGALNLYNYKYWWLCGLIAPHFGAVIGIALHSLLIHLHKIRNYDEASSSRCGPLRGNLRIYSEDVHYNHTNTNNRNSTDTRSNELEYNNGQSQ